MKRGKFESVLRAVEESARTWLYSMISLGATGSALREALRVSEQAEAIGFVIDPTLYRDAIQADRFTRQKAVLRAALDFRNALARVYPDDAPRLAALESSSRALEGLGEDLDAPPPEPDGVRSRGGPPPP